MRRHLDHLKHIVMLTCGRNLIVKQTEKSENNASNGILIDSQIPKPTLFALYGCGTEKKAQTCRLSRGDTCTP